MGAYLVSRCVAPFRTILRRVAIRIVLQATHLVPLQKKQELYFLYEKRVREFSNAEKVYEYFANDYSSGGAARMRPQDLLAALVAVYPPEGDQVRSAVGLIGLVNWPTFLAVSLSQSIYWRAPRFGLQ